jgi:hypothetical protein
VTPDTPEAMDAVPKRKFVWIPLVALLLLGLTSSMAGWAQYRGECPANGVVSQDGWSVSHQVTNSDGLEVHSATYNGEAVFTSAKLAEWHVNETGGSGFVIVTGCSPTGGFPVFPFGDTQVVTMADGFEIVQDFRMANWGANCNYRFEQRNQFFDDGRFRVVAGAFGRNCSGPADLGLNMPLIRINIAVNGPSNDAMDLWTGNSWQRFVTEDYRTPYAETGHGPHILDDDSNGWRIFDTGTQTGYLIQPSVGQFGDGGRGDEPFVFVLAHDPAEGDADLGAGVGPCCAADHQVGPHQWLNDEPVSDTDLVIWYVPQAETDQGMGTEYWRR